MLFTKKPADTIDRGRLARIVERAAGRRAAALSVGERRRDARVDDVERLEGRIISVKRDLLHGRMRPIAGMDGTDVLAGLEADLIVARERLARLTVEEAAANERWQRSARLAERCQAHAREALGAEALGERPHFVPYAAEDRR